MKRLFILVWASIALSGQAFANVDQMLAGPTQKPEQDAAHKPAISAQSLSMAWPLMPGESLKDLAQKLYPQDDALQARFLRIALRCPTNQALQLNADDVFKAPLLVQVPTAAALGLHSLPIKQSQAAITFSPLALSYQLASTPKVAHMSFWEQTRQSVSQNTALKDLSASIKSSMASVAASISSFKKHDQQWQQAVAQTVPAQPGAVAATKPETVKQLLKIDVAQDFVKNINVDRTKLFIIASLLLTALWLMRQHQKVLNKLDLAHIDEPASHASADDVVAPKASKQANTSPNQSPSKSISTAPQTTLAQVQTLVLNNRLSDAVDVLKAAILAAPKQTITLRLYLLTLLRELNWASDFETQANELHRLFNVMTPVWTYQPVEIVVASSLEEFTHIIEKLQSLWPSDKAEEFLQDLLSDNRGGERMGFSEAVAAEIALLIEVQQLREK